MELPEWWQSEFGNRPWAIMDCIEGMQKLPESSIDTIITDPPYGLEFMGKDWDAPWREDFENGPGPRKKENEGLPDDAIVSGRIKQMQAFQEWSMVWASEALRVAKPGAFLLCFGGTRTWHRLACAIEEAGWEIKDTIMYLYGSGFPKNYDISKGIDKAAGAERKVVGVQKHPTSTDRTGNKSPYQAESHLDGSFDITEPSTEDAQLWEGWGSSLKPSYEPILVSMKPVDRTFVNNALKHGVAGLHIDGARIESGGTSNYRNAHLHGDVTRSDSPTSYDLHGVLVPPHPKGRFPTNLILDEEAGAMLDAQTGKRGSPANHPGKYTRQGFFGGNRIGTDSNYSGDSGGPSRFFYTSKASRSERGEFNTHPTVKPLALMEYLLRLTATPTGGIVLDPFLGSGTTLLAARKVRRPCIGFEIDKKYGNIIHKRVYGDIPTDKIVKDVDALDFF